MDVCRPGCLAWREQAFSHHTSARGASNLHHSAPFPSFSLAVVAAIFSSFYLRALGFFGLDGVVGSTILPVIGKRGDDGLLALVLPTRAFTITVDEHSLSNSIPVSSVHTQLSLCDINSSTLAGYPVIN